MGESIAIVTPPAVEPVTLAEAKDHLRVGFVDDDGMITRMIGAARAMIETALNQTLITTVYDWTIDGFPASASGYFNRLVRLMGPSPQWLPSGAAVLTLPNPPIQSVESVIYTNSTGNLVTIDPDTYIVASSLSGRIQPIMGQVWPVVRPQIAGVTVRYTAGYGDTAADVPDAAKCAILLHVGDLYEHRESISDIQTYPVKDSILNLLATMDHGSYA